jgi:hypothetical protein
MGEYLCVIDFKTSYATIPPINASIAGTAPPDIKANNKTLGTNSSLYFTRISSSKHFVCLK